MTESEPKIVNETDCPPDILRLSRRDRWASTLAVALIVIHALAILSSLRWYYCTAQQWKLEIEGIGIEVSQVVQLLIGQSDMIVNYWYLLVPVAPPFFVVDFMLMRWIARQVGLRRAAICGICIASIFVINMAFGQFILSEEWSRLQGLRVPPAGTATTPIPKLPSVP